MIEEKKGNEYRTKPYSSKPNIKRNVYAFVCRTPLCKVNKHTHTHRNKCVSCACVWQSEEPKTLTSTRNRLLFAVAAADFSALIDFECLLFFFFFLFILVNILSHAMSNASKIVHTQMCACVPCVSYLFHSPTPPTYLHTLVLCKWYGRAEVESGEYSGPDARACVCVCECECVCGKYICAY